MEATNIEWCDHTFNIAWGCAEISPGCAKCYAKRLTERYGLDVWRQSDRKTMSAAYWKQPLKWNKAAAASGKSARVFCSSMADVFEDHPTINAERAKLWELIAATEYLDWLLLTKRPQNIRQMAPWQGGWPDNVWIGTSVENQHWANVRVPILAEIPATVKFLSCEPLLGPVNLRNIDGWDYLYDGISWVICGAESGHGARPMQEAWARSLKDQCVATSVPFFLKQTAINGKKVSLPELDGRRWAETPFNLPFTPIQLTKTAAAHPTA